MDTGRGDGVGGMTTESVMEIDTLPYVKWIPSGNLLYDPGDSNWGSMTT